MQSRRIIHYDGNTISRSWSSQSVRKRLDREVDPDKPLVSTMPFIEKTFATMQCYWCPHDFDSLRIVCDQCRSCEYCGMIPVSSEQCNICGNRLPEELKPPIVTIRAI